MLDKVNSLEVLNYCKKIAGHLGGDLHQDVILAYLEGKPIKHDNPIGWAKKTAFFMYAHPRSKFNRTYKPRPVDAELYKAMYILEDKVDDRLVYLEKVLKQPAKNPRENFKKEVFIYLNEPGNSTRKLAKLTDINHNTLAKSAKKFKNDVRERYKNYRG